MNLETKSFSVIYILTIFLLSIFTSCQRKSEGALEKGEHITQTIVADIETQNMPRSKRADSADDPAIWINANDAEKSLVIGTDKKGGLGVYNLQGEELSYLPCGKMNNVDVRYNFSLSRRTIDIVGASNRTTHSVDIFSIDETGRLNKVNAGTLKSNIKDEVYGFCLYESPVDSAIYAYINSKAGEVEQWQLFPIDDSISGKVVRSFSLAGQVEGMVADDPFRTIYIGEEGGGIWKFDAEPTADTTGVKLPNSSESNNENITYDIEGLAIYAESDSSGYLIASSQGNYSYAVFDRMSNAYLSSFRIIDGENIDGVEETDGIELTPVALCAKFPKGVFVVQDGFNYDDGKYTAQNFKIIDWRKIEALLK